jgi:hypothetical protein
MSDEYFDEFMAERKLRHDAEARIAQLGAALKLARAYVHNNSGGWCLEGIGSKEVLRRTDILGSESETKVQPETPFAWYRTEGGQDIFARGDWPPPEPDDTPWYPLYLSPEGRPLNVVTINEDAPVIHCYGASTKNRRPEHDK